MVLETSFTSRSSLDSALPRSSHNRSYPLPIQWLSLRDTHTITRPGAEKVNYVIEWYTLCSIALSKTYIPLPRPSIFCVFTTSLLPWTEVDFPDTIWQCDQTWAGGLECIWCCIWTICLLGTNTTTFESALPILSWTMPCLLGTKRVGYVLFYRPDPDI